MLYKAIVSMAKEGEPFKEVGMDNRFIVKANSLPNMKKKTYNLFIGDYTKVRVEIFRENRFYVDKPIHTWFFTQIKGEQSC